jgi:hypothetical protein
MSDHAKAAATVRAFLKTKGIQASVRSESFAGGTSLNVTLIDAKRSQVKMVREMESLFEYGDFNPYTDTYLPKPLDKENTLPKVKYFISQARFSEDMLAHISDWAFGDVERIREIKSYEDDDFWNDYEKNGEV